MNLETDARRSGWLTTSVGVVAALVISMWAVEVVDGLLLQDRLQNVGGILPRRTDGLDGIVFSPFLHAGLGHLVANTIPLAILGGLVALRGPRAFVMVTLAIMLVGGGLTWLLARSANHIGASGLVFGYFGYLVGRAFFSRRAGPIIPAIIAVVLYGGAVLGGFIPQSGVSWEGHLFGAVAGLAVARALR